MRVGPTEETYVSGASDVLLWIGIGVLLVAAVWFALRGGGT